MDAVREGVKKKRFFGTLSQTMGRWGSKFSTFLVKITIQLFLLIFRTLSENRGGGGWVGVQSPKQIHGTLSEKVLIFSKKIRCSKQPKKQYKHDFYFSLSGVPNVHVFFDTFPYEVGRYSEAKFGRILKIKLQSRC